MANIRNCPSVVTDVLTGTKRGSRVRKMAWVRVLLSRWWQRCKGTGMSQTRNAWGPVDATGTVPCYLTH